MSAHPSVEAMSSVSSSVYDAAVGVLVVSADAGLRRSLISKLQSPHWVLQEAVSGADALDKLDGGENQLLLLDPSLPDLQAAEFRVLLRTQYPHLQVLTVNPHTGQPLLPSPTPGPLTTKVIDTLERLGPLQIAVVPQFPGTDDRLEKQPGLPEMVGDSEAMCKVYATTQLVARRDTTVLITGASGTGKDLVARAIHKLSSRRANPFVVVNCAAIPEPLLEAELFGYVKGAFTGAAQSRIGRIHSAQGGTLFLDEIGELPIGLQSKLLRFLEQGELQRLGSSDNFRVDVRVVAATNAPLKKLIQEGRFREDLYYRIAVFPIDVPPLQTHMSDLLDLAETFLRKFCGPRVFLSSEAVALLQQHSWPGNVRELRNVIERASILVGEGREIFGAHIVL